MPNNPQISTHIPNKSKTNLFLKCQCPITLSPPDLKATKNDMYHNQKLDGQMKGTPRRLFCDHSSRLLMDTPLNSSGTAYHRFFVTLDSSNSFEKKEVINTSFGSQDEMTKEMFSMNPEETFFELMLEMGRTRVKWNLNINCDYWEELLTIFLVHNEKSLYEYIFSAYVRVMVSFAKTYGAQEGDARINHWT